MITKCTREQGIKAKVKLGIELTKQEESFYLLYYANYNERCEYMRNKKGGKGDETLRANH